MRKPFIIIVGACLLIFFFVIAYWTVLPRTTTLDIPGEGIYTGQLKGMASHGYGTYESYVVGGTSYEGEWKNGVFHGQGTLSFCQRLHVLCTAPQSQDNFFTDLSYALLSLFDNQAASVKALLLTIIKVVIIIIKDCAVDVILNSVY